MSININKTLRLTDGQYFKEETKKTQIVLHHTVGGSAKSTFNYWQSTPDRVATAYLVERDGTIYEVFDPKYWAWHLGLKTANNTECNKKSIGIELASEGALRSGKELNDRLGQPKFDENYIYAFDIDTPPFAKAKKLYHFLLDQEGYYQCFPEFRGYSLFDCYDEPQIVSTINLVNYLCEIFNIPKQLLPDEDKFEYNANAFNFNGIITHTNVRKDKSDLSPAWSWKRLEESLKIV